MEPRLPLRRAWMPIALVVVSTITVAVPAAPALAKVRAPESSAGALITEDVSFRNGDVTVSGTVIAPTSAGTGRPGIVLVPGAGEGLSREWYRPHAEAFAEAGIVALIYDKRSAAEGYSLFEGSITDLADDAIAGVQLLRDRSDVDPDMVGVHGHSEGGWTVVAAGNRSRDVRFVVASGASALPPERTQVWMNQTQLRHAGVKESLLRPLGETLTRHVVEAGQFRLAGHDPITPLEQLDQPVLGVFAEHDRSAPPGESLELFRQALGRGGNTNRTLRVISGVDHLMLPNRDGFDVDLAQRASLGQDYVDTVTAWVQDVANGRPASGSDVPPPQDHRSAPLAPLSTFESLPVQLAALGVLALAFGSYPVTAVIRRLRGRRDPVPARWFARTLAVAGSVVPPLTLGYVGFIMITAGQAPGPVVAGRPLAWLVLQLGALSVAVATVALIARWWRERFTPATNARLAALVAGAAVFLPWSAYWGLFTL